MKNEVNIRIARAADAEKLLDIYTPYINKTAITFEYTPPAAEEFRARIEKTLQKYPYLVAEINGVPVGYTYAGTYIPRTACDHACKASIYLAESFRGNGIGEKLYSALENILAKQNITNIYASVAFAEHEDEYLTHSSVRFHKRMGYKEIGRFSKCGYKFGKWYDLLWFEKFIGEHTSPNDFLPFPLVYKDFL